MKKLKKFVRKYGFDIVAYKTHNGIPDPLNPWELDSAFISIYQDVVDKTLVDRKKLYMLWQLVKRTNILQGAIAECGVYKGGTALLIAKTMVNEKELHLFDTFEGMPQTDPSKDEHSAGDLGDTSIEAVSRLFTGFENVKLHKGFFPHTADLVQNLKFSLVHCDMDIYTSVIDCCRFFYPRLVPGGVIIFDDYGAPSCPGAKQAVEEFCAEIGIYEMYLPSGQAVITKYI